MLALQVRGLQIFCKDSRASRLHRIVRGCTQAQCGHAAEHNYRSQIFEFQSNLSRSPKAEQSLYQPNRSSICAV